ncbi:MAG: hypothetical protein Q8R47_05190 [Nanoarchaeota archaeon]|nr:hypothetical protein [Nanoarchaeota archaeon]
MVRILIGGPEGEQKDIHDDLVARLKQEHAVTYLKNDGQGMFWELTKTPLIQKEERYDLILYDSDLFYHEATPEKKIECFEALTAKYLASAQAPVIILAEMQLAMKLHPLAEKAGFTQIDEPYNLEQTMYKIAEILRAGSGSDQK